MYYQASQADFKTFEKFQEQGFFYMCFGAPLCTTYYMSLSKKQSSLKGFQFYRVRKCKTKQSLRLSIMSACI